MDATGQKDGLARRNTSRQADAGKAVATTMEVLKRELQEQRRANTLLLAEIETERQAREALQTQLVETNTEVIASWDRRKEMARVIGERDAELSVLRGKEKQFNEAQPELVRLRQDVKAANDRRKEMAKIIDNRGARIKELERELKDRFAELAILQRHIAKFTLAGQARRIAGAAQSLVAKSGGKAQRD